MTNRDMILAQVNLSDEVNVIPSGGITVPTLRVDLVDEKSPREAWIAEISILGDLPWFKGEKRQVEFRVMSDEFREYIVSKRPRLFIKRGSEIIGCLEILTDKNGEIIK